MWMVRRRRSAFLSRRASSSGPQPVPGNDPLSCCRVQEDVDETGATEDCSAGVDGGETWGFTSEL